MGKVDIRQVKKALRDQFKQLRREMTSAQKQQKDQGIFQKVTALEEYRTAKLFLCFVSTPIEVDTHRLILHALEQGKRVAVPRCIDGTSRMDFYLIRSMDDLEPCTFSVLEPVPDRCEKLADFREAFCIVPGLGFDMQGFRLGYGKGYYDRFLADFPGKTAGICYNCCMRNLLPHGRYDRAVDILVTEKYVKRF